MFTGYGFVGRPVRGMRVEWLRGRQVGVWFKSWEIFCFVFRVYEDTGSDRRAVGDGQRGTRAGITEDGAKGCEGLLPGGEPVEQQQRHRLEQQRAQEEQAA